MDVPRGLSDVTAIENMKKRLLGGMLRKYKAITDNANDLDTY